MYRRQAIYDFIVSFKMAHDGNGPTMRQVAEAIPNPYGKPPSTSVISFHLKKLEEDGRIVRGEGGIEIVGGRWVRLEGVKELLTDALWIDGEHHKQWYLERIAELLSVDLDMLDHEMARAGNYARGRGIAP